jgi:hypothetical protein
MNLSMKTSAVSNNGYMHECFTFRPLYHQQETLEHALERGCDPETVWKLIRR